MALADTSHALGAVTNLLVNRLSLFTQHNVTVGRPEPSASGAFNNPRLNLFLYEATFDPHMRGVALDEGQIPPLWMVLRYLMTPFDSNGLSDTPASYRILGDGLRSLQELAYLPLPSELDADDLAALSDNPEPLKITFTESSSDLLSRLMQGSDEKYRFSMAFEVRPVMISQRDESAYSLLVGIDYTLPPVTLTEGPVSLLVEPTLGPVVDEVVPASFSVGDTSVALIGADFDLSDKKIRIGSVELGLTFDADTGWTFDPSGGELTGANTSAGSHKLELLRVLDNGRRRPSNPVIVDLLPIVSAVRFENRVDTPDPPIGTRVSGDLVIDGELLGGDEDDIFVALYDSKSEDVVIAASFDDASDESPPASPQTTKRVSIPGPGVPFSDYLVIVRVNGKQARQSLPWGLP